MQVYKVIFANNEVHSCEKVSSRGLGKDIRFNGSYQYAHNNGRLLYAFISTISKTEAENVARTIIRKVGRVLQTAE
jgi:hypothetical protein